jgi:hypothetical protein
MSPAMSVSVARCGTPGGGGTPTVDRVREAAAAWEQRRSGPGVPSVRARQYAGFPLRSRPPPFEEYQRNLLACAHRALAIAVRSTRLMS